MLIYTLLYLLNNWGHSKINSNFALLPTQKAAREKSGVEPVEKVIFSGYKLFKPQLRRNINSVAYAIEIDKNVECELSETLFL